MADSLELQVSSALETIKPAETRVAAWQSLLQGMFKMEVENLMQVKNDEPTYPKIPTTPEEIELAIKSIAKIEQDIKDLKKKATLTQEKRKEFSSKIDAVVQRLMLPEKTYDEYVKKLSAALLPIKKIEQAEQLKKTARIEELRQFRNNVQQGFNGNVAEQMRYSVSKANEVYKFALDNVSISDKLSFIQTEKHTFAEDNSFACPANSSQDVEKQAIIDEIYSFWDSSSFVSKFNSELDNFFAGFDKAKLDISEAKRIATEKLLYAEDEVKEELQVSNQIAEMDVRVDMVPTQTTRQLKTVYLLDMEKTEANAVLILKAAFANWTKVLAEYRGKDVWDISFNKFADLLCILKNKDENFNPIGIVFKSDSKL